MMIPKPAQEYRDHYRGFVVDVDDPERRNRYRVHVIGVHRYRGHTTHLEDLTYPAASAPGIYESMGMHVLEMLQAGEGEGGADTTVTLTDTEDLETYPWAEVVSQSAKHAGFHSPLIVGDTVWVVFENGNTNYPLIIGNWLTASSGASDLIPELAIDPTGLTTGEAASGAQTCPIPDYLHNSRRWTWTDRRGNLIELSELMDENWVRLKSGAATLMLKNADDSVSIETPGSFILDLGSLVSRSTGAFLSAETEMILEACGDPSLHDPIVALYSTWELELYAQDQVAIGQYLSRQPGKDDEGSDSGSEAGLRHTVHQSRFAFIAPKTLFLGLVCPEAFAAYTHYCDSEGETIQDAEKIFDVTRRLRIEATDWIYSHSGQRVVHDGSGSDPDPLGFTALLSGEIVAEPSRADYPVGSRALEDLRRGDFLIHSQNYLLLFSDLETWFSPGASVYPVQLSITGGNDGSVSDGTYASWTYSATRLDSGRTLAVDVPVLTRRSHKGSMRPASYGLLVIRANGELGILFPDEQSFET